MAEGLMSKVVSRFSRKVIQQAVDTRLAEELNSVLVNYKIRPKEKPIFHSESEAYAHIEAGYSDEVLNRYIIAKSARWLESLRLQDFVLPPHIYSLLFVLGLVQVRSAVPVRIIDFGGGAPTMPALLRQLGTIDRVASYRIVESPAFVRQVPPAWSALAEFSDTYAGEPCDMLILSGVLPYLNHQLVQSVYDAIRKAPPRFIYFGRTSFLRADYAEPEAYTIQESRFKDHGAQVDVGMADIEGNMARYVRRHLKWAELAAVLDPLGYQRTFALSDESGLENIKGLGLYANNSLWERPAHVG
ncbi:MAG TPA: hypothetical protein VEA40_27345 [Ramlibacter sp.]|nr:hypothetical protein [Ramlibacter sp.]